jgi:hypothetical protein
MDFLEVSSKHFKYLMFYSAYRRGSQGNTSKEGRLKAYEVGRDKW